MIRAIVTALLAAACGATAGGAQTPSTTRSTPPQSALPPDASLAEALCRAALPNRAVVAWGDAHVGELRGYGYSGPVPHRPLRAAFPGVPAARRAAWCSVRDSTDTISVWGATPGNAAQRAITVTGPGAGNVRGVTHGPPIAVP